MHDPMTQAFQICFWYRTSMLGGKPWRYWVPLITVWHVDPEKDGSDDSCDWFGRRMTKREKEWAASLIEDEYDNLRNYFSTFVKLNHGENTKPCDDPDDCYCGEFVPTCDQREMISRVLNIASCYKRSFRRFRWHPRWHFWHWKIQIHPLQTLKRWAFSRCQKCGKGFSWGYCPVSTSWDGDGGPKWFRSERWIEHSDCGNPTSECCAKAN